MPYVKINNSLNASEPLNDLKVMYCDSAAQIVMVEKMTFNNYTLKKDAVIMIPGKEERKFFVIHVIVKDRTGLVNIVTREMTHVTDYCEHYQAYKLPENFRLREPDWRCFTLCDLDDTSFSFNNLCCRVTIHNLQIIQRFRGIQTGIDFNIGH